MKLMFWQRSDGLVRLIFIPAAVLCALAALLLLVKSCGNGEEVVRISPREFKSLTVYPISDERIAQTPDDVLRALRGAELGEAETRALFELATYRKKPYFWKGRCLGVVRLDDGSECRIEISFYGAFFRISGQKGVWNIEDDQARDKFHSTMKELSEKAHRLQAPSGE